MQDWRQYKQKMQTVYGHAHLKRPQAQRRGPARERIRCAAAADGIPAAVSVQGCRLFVGKRFGIKVEECMEPSRRLVDYVRLPAERYNVLDRYGMNVN